MTTPPPNKALDALAALLNMTTIVLMVCAPPLILRVWEWAL